MGSSEAVWAAFGIGGTISNGLSVGSSQLRAVLESDDIDTAFEELLEQWGLDSLEGELGGNLVYGDPELWSVVVKSTITAPADVGAYAVLPEPSDKEREDLRKAAELLGGWRGTWRIQSDFG